MEKYEVLDTLMSSIGFTLHPEEMNGTQLDNMKETLQIMYDNLKEEFQLVDLEQAVAATLPSLLETGMARIELEQLTNEWFSAEANKLVKAFDFGGDLGTEVKSMSVQDFMVDYALWVGHSAGDVDDPKSLTPRRYLEEFAEHSWLPSRVEMYDFLDMFEKDKVGIHVYLNMNFEWEDANDECEE